MKSGKIAWLVLRQKLYQGFFLPFHFRGQGQAHWEKQRHLSEFGKINIFSEYTFNSLFYNKANQINLSTNFSKLQFCVGGKTWN
jgi:hypothetical protein